ncbi:ribosome-associated translation inhibitor RaiA [Cetobacterium somerae]|uniref:ribosome hibernation-promoting factor, HPF/YfiA family n=1 Tax=Cetobacterium sp. NK01 TaxID=2993530 RepID=UPI002116F0BC|nr:ribosome-associated translation inhibitor RaiA [Cetobacterium sp. NK01]MCQ8212606.1 ribosome-associated translation inhibitor RaiA [Cetobacterium sp. NK01]
MRINYNTNGDLVLTDAIKNHCEKNFSKLKKFFDNILTVNVTLSATKSKTGPLQRVDARVHVNGTVIKGVYTDDDLYNAIDRVTEILAKQIKKHKEKLRDNNHSLPNISNPKKITFESSDNSITVQSTKKIESITVNPRPMDVEEAILQLEALNKDFYVFTNSETGDMNIVYKKRNGDYGHVEPAVF